MGIHSNDWPRARSAKNGRNLSPGTLPVNADHDFRGINTLAIIMPWI